MKIRNFIFLIILTLFVSVINASAQVDSVAAQVTSSTSNSFTGGTSGDGRLIVFESTGNIATENPRNTDGNPELFIFDYAQRRIFQITDTKPVLVNPSQGNFSLNTRVNILNSRATISNDGKWIAFHSNATTSTPGNPVNGTNPGNFDGNSFTNATKGADRLDLASAMSGVKFANIVQPTAPTVVRLSFTDFNASITAFTVDVVGTNAAGAAITETFTFANGLDQVGTQMFATITSVTVTSITGNGANDFIDLFYGDGKNSLTGDANLEMWLYQIPAVAPVDLSAGTEIPVTNLAGGNFIQVTNTPASNQPTRGSNSSTPKVAVDTNEPSISDDGNVIAFISNRNLVGTGNQPPQDNPEIFTYVRSTDTISQITQTPRGPISAPQNNNAPTISGDGMRVMFASNSNNPIIGMTGGSNADLNVEVFYADLNANGVPSGVKKQVTTTSPTNPGDIVNVVNIGTRMSRDGKFIAFDSYADLANENAGAVQIGFATYLYDVTADSFRRVGARSDADSIANNSGGDIAHYPIFTDYVDGTAQTLLFGTRSNINADGVVPTTEADGLNAVTNRPVQVYSYPLNESAMTAKLTRLTMFPPPIISINPIQIFPSNSSKRISLTIPNAEIGTGNSDFSTEVYYLLTPTLATENEADLKFATGATNIPVVNIPLPTPSPTPTPSPVPTPTTPAAVVGLSPGMLAVVNYEATNNLPATPVTAVGSLDRRFTLPIELAGVSMTINNVSVGLKSVSKTQITFTVPLGLATGFTETFPVVINNNGEVFRGEIVLVASRPDIFVRNNDLTANRARVLNVTNRVQTIEPFNVRTLNYRAGVKVPTVLRVFLTGVENIQTAQVQILIGETVTNQRILRIVKTEPGVYYIDFELPPGLNGAGDQPILINVTTAAGVFMGRLAGDAPRVRIL